MNRAILWYFGKRLGRKLRGPVGFLAAAAWVVGVVGILFGAPKLILLASPACLMIPRHLGEASRELNDIELVPLSRGHLFIATVLAPLSAAICVPYVPALLQVTVPETDLRFFGRHLIGITLLSFSTPLDARIRQKGIAPHVIRWVGLLIASYDPMASIFSSKVPWLPWATIWGGLLSVLAAVFLLVRFGKWLSRSPQPNLLCRTVSSLLRPLPQRLVSVERPDPARAWRWIGHTLLRPLVARWVGCLSVSLIFASLHASGGDSALLVFLGALPWILFATSVGNTMSKLLSSGGTTSQDAHLHSLPDWKGWPEGFRILCGATLALVVISGMLLAVTLAIFAGDWQRFPTSVWLFSLGSFVSCVAALFSGVISYRLSDGATFAFFGFVLLWAGGFAIFQSIGPLLPETAPALLVFSTTLLMPTLCSIVETRRAYLADPNRGLPIRAGERLHTDLPKYRGRETLLRRPPEIRAQQVPLTERERGRP